jgi:alkylation response protein AidB-like acyl-CoA dehydrogenase
MDAHDSDRQLSEDRLRAQVRGWLADNGPDELRGFHIEDTAGYNAGGPLREWRERLHAGGWLCLTWPAEYGGRGLTPAQAAVVDDEFARANLPRLTRGMSEIVAGPMILGSGTPEQKSRLIPRIVHGQDRYAQGFSEPGAGSDLVGLTTRGEVVGDTVRITGQKVWTSYWALATHVIALVRTDPAAAKHAGISAVVVPLEVDGRPNNVTFRGLREITGEVVFGETFFDGAVAPLENVIGGLGGGWAAAQHALASERSGIMTLHISNHYADLRALVQLAAKTGAIEDQRVQDDLAWAYTNLRAVECENQRLLALLASGEQAGPFDPSLKRLLATEFEREFAEIALRFQGAAALKADPGYELDRWQREYLFVRSRTIFGGTSQIHRNVIAERILGLPREPRTVQEKGSK